jgi:PPOX class probable FMN-dependent enzyme
MKFNDVVTDLAELRALVGEPHELARKKQIDHLDVHCASFIAHAPFVLIATADAAGHCDVSPKGDAPGFVQVLDDHRLVIPDRPGNKRFDGMRNILENPHIGLLFLVPGRGETLRVNGRAALVRDPDLLARMEVMGKRPLLAIGVEVEEAFLHCAKAFKRSGLWEPERWPDLSDLASSACMFRDHSRAAMSVEEMAARIDEGYRTRLY